MLALVTYFVIDSEGALPWVFSSFMSKILLSLFLALNVTLKVPQRPFAVAAFSSVLGRLLDSKADDCF